MPRATRTAVKARLARTAPAEIGLDALASEARVHPDLARRLVSLGLIEMCGGTAAAPLFRREDAALLARAVRLRADLGLNYAGAVLASELLLRIETLERRLRAPGPTQTGPEVIAWTRTLRP